MERSLTVLLPAHNVQSTLAADVTHALDVVSDLTGRFELVIVDDGSADATSEVIDELTRSYPQVRSVRHRRHRGRNEAIRTGLRHSTGEMIFLPDTGDTRKKGAYHMLDRETVERLHPITHPAYPSYSTHFLAAAPAEQFGGVPAVGSDRV